MESDGQNKVLGVVLLFSAALVFGSCYTASSIGMETIDAFTFNSIRFPVGAIFLFLCILLRNIIHTHSTKSSQQSRKKNIPKKTLFYGFFLGLVLFIAAYLQQTAFKYSTSGKIAFITSLYILFVPSIGFFLHRKTPFLTWIGIVIGITGLWFLSFSSNSITSINIGDVLALSCALFYAIQILLIDSFVSQCDPIILSLIQFLVAGILSVICMSIFESPSLCSMRSVIWAIIYSGIMSCGLGFTLQTLGQKLIRPAMASLILCTESIFGMIFAILFLLEYPSSREILGCILLLFAILIAQLPGVLKK